MSLEIQAAEPTAVELTKLTRDPELVCRAAGVSKRTAAEYSEAMKAGASFPPVVVFVDSKGVHWLADGFHRCAGAELAGLTEIAADLREGSRKDALQHAAGANATHGARRTQADVRRAIALVIDAFPKHSDRKIASIVGCHNETVGAVRKRLTESVTPGEPNAEGSEPAAAAPPASDATVARLSKALARILKQWPPERRAELQERLLAVVTEPLPAAPPPPG